MLFSKERHQNEDVSGFFFVRGCRSNYIFTWHLALFAEILLTNCVVGQSANQANA